MTQPSESKQTYKQGCTLYNVKTGAMNVTYSLTSDCIFLRFAKTLDGVKGFNPNDKTAKLFDWKQAITMKLSQKEWCVLALLRFVNLRAGWNKVMPGSFTHEFKGVYSILEVSTNERIPNGIVIKFTKMKKDKTDSKTVFLPLSFEDSQLFGDTLYSLWNARFIVNDALNTTVSYKSDQAPTTSQDSDFGSPNADSNESFTIDDSDFA